jgi:hypothetical protein
MMNPLPQACVIRLDSTIRFLLRANLQIGIRDKQRVFSDVPIAFINSRQ